MTRSLNGFVVFGSAGERFVHSRLTRAGELEISLVVAVVPQVAEQKATDVQLSHRTVFASRCPLVVNRSVVN